MTLSEAVEFAARAHHGQVDKGGVPYILHPLSVMMMVQEDGGNDQQMMAAVLHDVVEDTDFTMLDIHNRFGLYVAEMVNSLTRRTDEKYFDYIWRVSQNPDAAMVKICDIAHNCDKSRMSALQESEQENMTKRYDKALDTLYLAVRQHQMYKKVSDRCV